MPPPASPPALSAPSSPAPLQNPGYSEALRSGRGSLPLHVRLLRIAAADRPAEQAFRKKPAICRAAAVSASFLMGALSALIVGPRVAAPAGALYIGQTGDAVLGERPFFVMALGMGCR